MTKLPPGYIPMTHHQFTSFTGQGGGGRPTQSEGGMRAGGRNGGSGKSRNGGGSAGNGAGNGANGGGKRGGSRTKRKRPSKPREMDSAE